MKKALVFSFFAFGFLLVNAQKNFSIEEAILNGRTTLAPSKLKFQTFTKNPGELSYVFIEDARLNDAVGQGKECLTLIDIKGKKTRSTSLTELNDAVKKLGKEEMKYFPSIEWKDKTTFKFMFEKTFWEYDTKTKSLTNTKAGALTAGLENAEVSPDGITVVYTKDHNVILRISGNERPITTDGNSDLVYGEAVHRNEFGIEKGIFFSPNGTYVAFYRMDQSMVTDYPIVNWDEKPAKPKMIKYPFAGDKSHQVTLGVHNVVTGKTIYVKTEGDPEQYLTNIAWSNDESKIYIAVVNRAQTNMKLSEYSAASGAFIKTLFEENDAKYIEPLVPLMVVKNTPSQFIWQSNRDGYKHLYLYDFTGKMLKQLTKGNWEIKSINGFDAKGENLFFHCNYSAPVNQDFCSVNIKTGALKILTSGNGFHTCVMDASATYATDNFSNTTTPRITRIIDLKTAKFYDALVSPNPVAGYNIGKLKFFSIRNKENNDLYCRMFFPHDFDSTRKYPVVVYLYNGPHSQLVTNSWLAGADLWYHYMAQKGFIVFTLDGRGTDNRGKLWSQAIHRQCGAVEMEDQLSGVNYLKSLSYVDVNRLGVHGWSYGGFMTTSLMTRNAGIFKVAVAGGPVIDWSYYEIMYTERYMDTPQENPDGYSKNNLLNHIQNLEGKLLVIHGTNDDVVVWQHSLMLLKKAVEKKVQLDYYVYPGHLHNVTGKDRAHLMDKISNYFIENL
jgi:dipeptidyl-peptidase 4